MKSKRARLDRYISARTGTPRRDVKVMVAQGRVNVDGVRAASVQQLVDEFTHVKLDQQTLQANQPLYFMLNKPAGVVSATKDQQHTTVVDLLDVPNREQLHIVGRLDFNSTGLLLLTNDGRWSRRLMTPQYKVIKVYRVSLGEPITEECVMAFASGIHFPYENITTKPATLKILDRFTAEVHLMEGRYHQIKRMFGRFRIPVVSLHRTAIGNLLLDPGLEAGCSRALTEGEVGLAIGC